VGGEEQFGSREVNDKSLQNETIFTSACPSPARETGQTMMYMSAEA